MKNNSRLPKLVVFVVLILFGILTCMHPLYPQEQFLQHLGTMILLAILFADIRKDSLSVFSFVFFSIFILIHIIGARYIYSYVPYQKWINMVLDLFGNGPVMGLHQRNGYDRFVHFAFGILVFPILYEYISRSKINQRGLALLLTWTVIQTTSMVYELFEWALTLVLSTEAADDYNGQQGDLWDAQKDMFLALVGSTIMVFIYLIRNKCLTRNHA